MQEKKVGRPSKGNDIVRISLRVESSLRDRVLETADKQGLTLTEFVENALRDAIGDCRAERTQEVKQLLLKQLRDINNTIKTL